MGVTHDHRLLFAREADRMYRKRNGTCRRLWEQKKLPGRMEGRFLLVSAKRVEELLGVPGCGPSL